MATLTSSYRQQAARTTADGALRRMVAGAAGFDGAMGVFSLAAAHQIGGWLSISVVDVRITGGVFLLAAVTGSITAVRRSRDVRAIAIANVVFAMWCLALLGAGPNVLGIILLAGAAVTATATAVAELRLAATG
jgi:hypothetical protein